MTSIYRSFWGESIHTDFLKFSTFIRCLRFDKLSILHRNVNKLSVLHRNVNCSVVDNHQEASKPTMQSLKQLDLSDMRQPYKGLQETFDIDNLVSKEPFGQFLYWFEEAKSCERIIEANAMALATATKDGKPSLRMVLMKGIDKHGIVFYTNFLSQKATELAENPKCSLMFFWEPLMKMVRVEGSIERVPEAESTEYFHSRPRASQISACVSQQSSLVQSRQVLDEKNDKLLKKYSDNDIPVPKPDYWGGFRVLPSRFEFWQGQTTRLHDRIVFRKPLDEEVINPEFTHKGTDDWVYERLMP